MVNPLEGFYPYERNYEQLKEHLLEDETGKIPFNVFDSKTIDVYLTMLIHPLDDMDVDFYWLDNDDTKKLGESFLLNHYHFYDMMRNYKRRPMILARNSMIAASSYPVLYSGKTIVSWVP